MNANKTDASAFFGRANVTLFHGAPRIVRHPTLGVGNPNNDYGPGFYTTELQELAFEWACPRADDGWANEYLLDTRGLSIVDLNSDGFNVLNWMAMLLEHRKVSVGPGIAREARDFIIGNFAIELSDADLVHGYRADDSYFSMARSFLNNTIPVEVLEQALFLGGLGYQIALVSERAFKQVSWVAAEPAFGITWNPRRLRRDADARATAARLEQEAMIARGARGGKNTTEGGRSTTEGGRSTTKGGRSTFIIDIMRGDTTWQR